MLRNYLSLALRNLFLQNGHSTINILGLAVGMVALAVLFIACVNFTNYSMARTLRRKMEIGMRKVLGSGNAGLAQQFFVENAVTTLIASFVGLSLVVIAAPQINRILGMQLQIPWANISFYGAAFVIALLVGLVAGAYPATAYSSENAMGS